MTIIVILSLIDVDIIFNILSNTYVLWKADEVVSTLLSSNNVRYECLFLEEMFLLLCSNDISVVFLLDITVDVIIS